MRFCFSYVNIMTQIDDKNSTGAHSYMKIAHRGYHKFYGENTLEAFTSALHENFHMIEFDVQLCKSGELIIYHDTHIEYNTIATLTLNEILRMKPAIPTLEDLYNIPNIDRIHLYIDIKGHGPVVERLHEFVVQRKERFPLHKIWFGSFNAVHIERLYNLRFSLLTEHTCTTCTSRSYSLYQIGFITANVLNEKLLELFCIYWPLDFICIDWTMLDPSFHRILREKRAACKIFVYTCEISNPSKLIGNMEIDGIVSDCLLCE